MSNKRYRTRRNRWLRLGYMLAAGLSTQVCLAQQEVHLDGILGTSVDVTIYGAKEKQVKVALDEMLKEAARLENILSTWQETSQITQLNKTGELLQAPEELHDLLALCEHWHNSSKGIFSCRMGAIKQIWEQAEVIQVVPDRVATRRLARDLQQLDWSTKREGQGVTLAQHVQIDPAGVAKGYVIDRLMLSLRTSLPYSTGIKLDIGGDMLFWGKPDDANKWSVGLLNEDQNIVDINSVKSIAVSDVAVASSGHKQRFVEIERRKFSHILQPDEGWPMDDAPYAVVIAPNAATADAIATALSTQPATNGIDWVNSIAGVEASVTSMGIQLNSKGWSNYVFSDGGSSYQAANNLTIDYQIPRINSSKYHRPYLAIWITDTSNNSVRNLMLLGESERWAKENTRWWRRVGRKIPGVLEAVARPTRLPGKYHIAWDHLNDKGHLVEPGKYWLHMEAAREGGGHDYQKIVLNTDTDWQDVSLPVKGELGEVSIHKHHEKLSSLETENPITLVEVRP